MSSTPEKKAPAAVTPDAQKPKKGRSPAYPVVALDKAIEMSRKVYDGQRKQEAHIDSTLRALGYTSQSGASLRAVAALKQYALVQDAGEGDNRRIKLTDSALDIIQLPDSDARKVAAIRAAALAPAIHFALWERYGTVLPDDSSMLGYLVRDRGYHDEAATDIVSNYRTTFALAKLDKEVDANPDESASKPDVGGKPALPALLSTPAGTGSYTAPMSVDLTTQEMPFLVGPGKVARVPFPMTEEDYDLFVGMLALAKKKLTAIPKPKGRAAIWKNNSSDQPILVIGEMVAPDGAVYYKIEGSEAGIPASQVVFAQS